MIGVSASSWGLETNRLRRDRIIPCKVDRQATTATGTADQTIATVTSTSWHYGGFYSHLLPYPLKIAFQPERPPTVTYVVETHISSISPTLSTARFLQSVKRSRWSDTLYLEWDRAHDHGARLPSKSYKYAYVATSPKVESLDQFLAFLYVCIGFLLSNERGNLWMWMRWTKPLFDSICHWFPNSILLCMPRNPVVRVRELGKHFSFAC